MALTAVSAVLPIAGPTSVDAATRHHRHRYYRTCHRHDGTTGAIVGGVGGALVGGAVTHGAAGPIIGGVGGALLGRHIERHNTRYRC